MNKLCLVALAGITAALSGCAVFKSPEKNFIEGVEMRVDALEPLVMENVNNERTEDYTEAQAEVWKYFFQDFREFIQTAKETSSE